MISHESLNSFDRFPSVNLESVHDLKSSHVPIPEIHMGNQCNIWRL